MKAAFSVATIAAVCALGAAAAPSMEKRDDDWAYFCDDSAGTQNCGEGVAMDNSGCNLNEAGRGSLLYNQNGAEYILGVFTDGTCSTVVTTYDINPGAIASVDDGVQQLDPSNTYYGFCADSGCTDLTTGTE